MKITFWRVFLTFLAVSIFVILFNIISNCYLTTYELEIKLNQTNRKFGSLNHYFNKFENLSFPIKYSLRFYEEYSKLPVIYVITPTNNRVETQLADLTRLRNTLWLVPKLVWILVEDSGHRTHKITRFLEDSQIESVHLNEETSSDLVIKSGEKKWAKPRGVQQRNKALQWLRENSQQIDPNGVVYFADDDNTYDLRLFEEIRSVRKVGVWPVAFVGELLYERPICRDGKVVDWFVAWSQKRPFPLDMAGFAIHLNLILAHPSARFSQFVPRGMQESHLLSNIVRLEDLECKAENSTKIFVWHTNTKKVLRAGEKYLVNKNLSYDHYILTQI